MGIFDRFPYSSTHEMNLDFMLGKATEIAEDMQTVATGMAQVQAGLSAISEKTEQATQAAAQAAQSASSIEGSVTAAEEAAEEAQMHNESAQTWANNAMTYKADCQRSATEAAASSASAAQAATAAAGSEDTVAQYAQAANASAQSAANNNDSAHQYANQASASASNATFHSSNAQTAATNAQTAATNAQTAATRTAALKDDCETLHRMCTAAVDQAATEAVNAANSAAQAATTKTDVEKLVESLPEDFTDLNNTVNQLSDETDDLSEKVDQLADLTTAIVIKTNVASPLWTAGGYKDASGNVQTNSSYSYSDLIPVSPGDIVRSAHMRFITAYKTETTTSYSDFKTDVTEYVVSDVTNYIVISKANSYTSEPIYIEHTETQNSALSKITVLETVCNGTPGIRKTGNLSNGSLGFNAFAAIRKGKTYSFYGKISSFNKLIIGCGTNTVNSSNIEIDTTNVKFNNATATINTTAHGLTFLNYIYVIVDINGNAFPTVTIYTDGGNFTKTYADEWIGSAAAVHADADSSTTLTDCILTFSASDVKKNIWYCGDSYMAVRDGGKLPSKLKYFNVFQNLNSIGFSGAGSENVLPYVLTMFGMDLTPKYLVWAIGMNNGDTSSAVNATWKAGYDKLTELASSGNFELILATIPNTPTINNNFKNDIVRNSGFRYIDFADAVQTSQGESTWISGMLSSDNIHPTAEGAKALASRLCADFPEIFN